MLVKIEKSELDRLRTIETATREFIEQVDRTGTKPAIAKLLNKASKKAGR